MNELKRKDKEFIWHPFTQSLTAPDPIVIKKASGAYLYTDDGHRLLDGISSWWVNSHGHAHPHINQAIAKQADKLEHVIFASFTHEPAINLAEKLIQKAPKGLKRVFYSDNGSTAVESALKMAFQYWHNKGENRPYILSLEHAYHGDTFGAMAASERSVFTKAFWPLLFNVLKAPSTCVSEINASFAASDITHSALKKLDLILQKYNKHIAAIIIEPMLQGAGGMRIFTPGFLRGIRSLCDAHKILLIADEVATGFYRTGLFFACNHEDISPDIMCIAKGLSGGYLPLAATLATEAIFEAFLSTDKSKALLHGHSFTANPLGCAAALASLDLFERHENQENIKKLSELFKQSLKLFSDAPIKNARSLGPLIAIELDAKGGYLSEAAQAMSAYCYKEGLYIRPLGNIIYFMPPFCLSPEEALWALELIQKAIKNITI
jgi:adenosylmethionine-8-amino-7-oxononanoate aminotransferase